MSISLNLQSVDGSSPVNNLHNVQCEIVHNGSASVKDHFLSAVKETEHGERYCSVCDCFCFSDDV